MLHLHFLCTTNLKIKKQKAKKSHMNYPPTLLPALLPTPQVKPKGSAYLCTPSLGQLQVQSPFHPVAVFVRSKGHGKRCICPSID